MKKSLLSCRDPDFFTNYAGSGKTYKEVWNDYSYASELADFLKKNFKGRDAFKKIMILGAASGEVLKVFDHKLGVKSSGCEINTWAYKQIPAPYRRKISNSDMRDYVKLCLKNKKHFDVAFSNSLIYLPKKEIPKFLKNLAKLVDFVHFNSSFKGHACSDPYRQTTETYDWWDAQFERAGFTSYKIKKVRRSYLWHKSKNNA